MTKVCTMETKEQKEIRTLLKIERAKPQIFYKGTTQEFNEWLFNEEIHRDFGPAVEEINGTKIWYHSGRKHREDGPAVEYPCGRKKFWVHGVKHTEEEYRQWQKESRKKPYVLNFFKKLFSIK